jgi:hypothetical protein
MIEHTVTFRLRHPANSPQERSFLAAVGELATIPGVREFSIRRQVSPKYDHAYGITMRFENQEAYDRYNAHPRHAAFVRDRWIPEVAAFQEADFVPLDR